MVVILIDHLPKICPLKRISCLGSANVSAAIVEIGGLQDWRLKEQSERIVISRTKTSAIATGWIEDRIAGCGRNDSIRVDRRSDGMRPDHNRYNLGDDTGLSGSSVKRTRAHHDSRVFVAVPTRLHIECPKRQTGNRCRRCWGRG